MARVRLRDMRQFFLLFAKRLLFVRPLFGFRDAAAARICRIRPADEVQMLGVQARFRAALLFMRRGKALRRSTPRAPAL